MLSELTTCISGAGWRDSLGIVASIGCAIHCAAMPLAVGFLPMLGMSFLADESFHQWMAVGCFFIALAAFVPGLYRHGRMAPLLTGSVGLAMISIAAFGFAGECCKAHEADPTTITQIQTAACTHACCAHCASENPSDSSSDDTSPEEASASTASPLSAGFILPFLTPLGGLVLVGAHLLNRHCHHLCHCGCGGSQKDSPTC